MSGPATHGLAGARRLELDEHELESWGRKFGVAITAPRVVALSGDLGAGKTTLAKAICAGLGVAESVTSPTFALIHSYAAPRFPVFHVDLYRLTGEAESAALGLEELVAQEAVTIIEWPERAGSLLPADAVRILLEHVPDDTGKRSLQILA